MNEQRLMKIIEDMSESVDNIRTCRGLIDKRENDEMTPFVIYGLKQIFVDFFITVEDFNSLMLKELRKFKIGIDMKESLNILKQNQVIDEEKYIFLNEARLIRNRISHRYKEPSKEELLGFIGANIDCFESVLSMVKNYLS
ncbi:MAG: HepT-like ribonuclease domain-containing protein [Cellulosilyticaceae bacterium]